MSKKQITLTPASRKANRAEFVKANPWTPGKTIAEIKTLVDSGEHELAGPFVFAEVTGKTKKANGRKGATATVKANVKAKRSKKQKQASKAKQEEFRAWLAETAEERKAKKKFRREAAAWAHENGVVPNGSAWDALKAGERDVMTLKALNKADDLRPAKGAVKPKKAEKVEKVEIMAKVEGDAPARPRRTNGTFMNQAEADLYRHLTGNGLDEGIARKAVTALGAPA